MEDSPSGGQGPGPNWYRRAADALAVVVLLWALAMLFGFVPRFANFASLHREAVMAFETCQAVTPEVKRNVVGLWNAEAASNGLLAISWSAFALTSLIQALLGFLARRREAENRKEKF